jgi:hypothetical protein
MRPRREGVNDCCSHRAAGLRCLQYPLPSVTNPSLLFQAAAWQHRWRSSALATYLRALLGASTVLN